MRSGAGGLAVAPPPTPMGEDLTTFDPRYSVDPDRYYDVERSLGKKKENAPTDGRNEDADHQISNGSDDQAVVMNWFAKRTPLVMNLGRRYTGTGSPSNSSGTVPQLQVHNQLKLRIFVYVICETKMPWLLSVTRPSRCCRFMSPISVADGSDKLLKATLS